MTVEDITKLAMQEMGVIAAGVTPTSAEYALGLKRLNIMIPALQNDNVFLALQDVQSITTVVGEKEYVSKVGTFKIRGFADDEVNILSRKDYDQYENGVTGRTDVFIEYNYDPPIIQFVEEPTEINEFLYRRDKLMTDLVSGQEPVFRKNALEMIILGLAYRLCPAYVVPSQKRAEIKADFFEAESKYKVSQSRRIGDEIVAPTGIV